MTQALQGVRVLDMTRVLAGPLAAQVLADLGADVIKVERPQAGDDSRGWGPPFQRDRDGNELPDSLYFLCCNRGKRSVTVDLAHPQGQTLIRHLAGQCDVLMENYKVGDLERYGLGYAVLSALNPRLIYCSITGFGQDGPYAKRPGYDPVVQAMGGLMSVTGERDSPPQRVGVAVTDTTTALYAVIAIQAALRHRDLTGEGQRIDLALLDVQMASMINVAQAYLSAGQVGERNGNPHPSVMPSQSYPCSDGLVMLAAGNDGQFRKLCEALGATELARDARFQTNSERFANRDALNALLEAITRQHTTAQLTEKLSACGVPCGPVQSIAQAFADPQVRHREIEVKLPDDRLGQVSVVASPLRLSGSPVRYDRAPPALGVHTDEVLTTVANLSAEQIGALRAAKAI
ncbi:MAG: CoA transferase [Betaproteobacteria bacterium]|nr:CoA transferase [Betaproteobacteria bacterium]